MSKRSVLGNDPFVRGAAARPKRRARDAVTGVDPHPTPPAELPVSVVPPTEPRPTSRFEPVSPPDLSAVRAAGMGGAAPLDDFDPSTLDRTVGRVEKLLRSLLGPERSSEVQEVITELSEQVRTLLTSRNDWRPPRDASGRPVEFDPFGRDPHFERRVQALFRTLFEKYFRTDVRGITNVPAEGRCLLVCNHSGALPYDGAMVKTAVELRHPNPRSVRPLVEDFVFHFPFLGTFVNRYGGVRACQENAERLLAQDALVAVFPEGVKGLGKLYQQRYQLQRFGRGGFVKLCLRTDTPLVPVAIVGAEEIHPILAKLTTLARPFGIPYLPITPTFPLLGPLGLIPLPAKWIIEFGEPIPLGGHGPEAAEDRILVSRLTDQVRSRIQSMVDAILADRQSVLFG